jgi:hypothetical protein
VSDKPPDKFTMTMPDGTKQEIDVPPSQVDMNHPLLNELQIKLLRLKPGEELKVPSNHFDAVTTDPLDLTVIGEIGIVNGCNVAFDRVISENPPVRGYIFTRLGDVPLMDWIEPEGGVQ